MAKIYTLIDPYIKEIRYVGRTRQKLERRLQAHLLETKRIRKSKKLSWLRSLDIPPIIECVQDIPDDYENSAEIYWISYFNELGCMLTNSTLGGEGGIMDLETRLKISNTLKGRKQSEATKLKRSLSNTGKRRSTEFCNSKAKTYIITYPNGEEITITNLKQFCSDNNLNKASMYRVAQGIQPHYKQYKVRV